MGKTIAAVLISVSMMTAVFSQYPAPRPFKILNVTDGLPQSFVSGMVQDSTGFIWIGTRDGLARYDGKRFKIFRNVPRDTSTISNNTIIRLYLDKQSRLWVHYETGDIDVLNTTTEALFHLTKDPVYKALSASAEIAGNSLDDTDGNTWLLSNDGGLFACNINKHTCRFYSENSLGLRNNKLIGITSLKGNLILATDTALIKADENMKFMQTIPYTFTNPHLLDTVKKWRDTYYILNSHKIFIHQDYRLIIYDDSAKSFTVASVPVEKTKLYFNMTQDNDGQVFFCYDSVIYKLSPENKVTIYKTKEGTPAYGYKSMLVDRSGVLWLGGNGSGLSLFDLRLPRMTAKPYVKKFHEDILLNYLKVPSEELRKSFLNDIHPYGCRWMEDRDGKIWFSRAIPNASSQPQVCYYKSGHLITPAWKYTNESITQHNYINVMAVSRSGKLWGMDFYLRPVYFDTLTHAVTVYPSITKDIELNHDYTVNSLLIDGEDDFWISTALNGLFKYDKKQGKTIHYFYSHNPESLPTNQLMNLIRDPDDNNILWMGSLGAGLIKFDKTTGKSVAFTTREGLPDNTVYAVVTDNKGILWCSSNKGIFSFNPKSGIIRSFTSKDGLPGDEYNRYHFLKLPDGRITFGGVDGYTVFNPLEIANDNFQPQVALTAMSINNLPADVGSPGSHFKNAVNSLPEIKLDHTQNFLTFEFAALQYNVTEKLHYRFMLEGIDKKWVYAGNDNIATYTNISPGDYVFKINATNTAGIWSSHIKTVSVTIKPPFWKTWWFIILGIMIAAAFIYFLIKLRIANVRKEEQQKMQFEREASELKAQALRAQMNPHFIFNCLNSIKALIQEDNKQQAVIYLTTFSKLIRNQLNNAQRTVSLHEELETCKLYTKLEALRFGSAIVCEFKIDQEVDTHSIQVPPLILQPFIENSIWHGILPKGKGNVTVSVSQQGDYIRCAIEDDGIGRETSMRSKSQTSATYQSKGMKLVQGRLSLHNIIDNQGGTIELIDKKDGDQNPAGTLIIVTFKKVL